MLAGIVHSREVAVQGVGNGSGLMTLGGGFDKERTGLDNILLGGAFLGLDDGVTRQLLPSIIDYAELGDFIDAHPQTHSSVVRPPRGARPAPVNETTVRYSGSQNGWVIPYTANTLQLNAAVRI